MMRKFGICFLLLAPIACAPDLGDDDYVMGDRDMVSTISTGTIVDVRKVKIHREQKGSISQGAVTGGAVGGVAGALTGGSTGQSVTRGAIGALAGAGLGHLIGEKTRTQKAFEYIIRLDNTGQEISTLQRGAVLSCGTRVRVYMPRTAGGRVRVVPINEAGMAMNVK